MKAPSAHSGSGYFARRPRVFTLYFFSGSRYRLNGRILALGRVLALTQNLSQKWAMFHALSFGLTDSVARLSFVGIPNLCRARLAPRKRASWSLLHLAAKRASC